MPVSLPSRDVHAHDVGVSATPSRRRLRVACRLKILDAAAGRTRSGALSALLCREGHYSSHLAALRAAQRGGELAESACPRGLKAVPPYAGATRIAELEHALARATGKRRARGGRRRGSRMGPAHSEQMHPPPDDAPTGRR